MSRASVKAAALALLVANPTTPPLASIGTQYVRLDGSSAYPRLVIWDSSMSEQRKYGGGITPGALGTKTSRWQLEFHLVHFAQDIDANNAPIADDIGEIFEDLLDEIEALIRANPWLAGGTDTSAVRAFGEEMTTRRLPPDYDSAMHVLYQAIITVVVEEDFNA